MVLSAPKKIERYYNGNNNPYVKPSISGQALFYYEKFLVPGVQFINCSLNKELINKMWGIGGVINTIFKKGCAV
jgi:hypothetical protein